MPDSQRDPRIDPKVGDIIQPRGAFWSFTVLAVWPDGSITGRFQSGIRGALCNLAYWRSSFAKDAKVISPPPASIAPSDDGLAKASSTSTAPDPGEQAGTSSKDQGDAQ